MSFPSVTGLRAGLCALLLCSSVAYGQDQAAPARSCPVQPRYPLSNDPSQLRALADRLEALASDPGCLRDAPFHAWRGAVLVALGRPVDAVESLERALLIDPDLPGATLDMAQALAQQGDQASATALLDQLRQRSDLPEPIRIAIDQRKAAIASQATAGRSVDNGAGWHSRWQVTAMAGYDTNLNNAPFRTEILLTVPGFDPTLATLDPSARPRRGAALLTSAQWQGLKAQGESVWVLQGELRSRATGESGTSYQQADASASWLQAPTAPRQWVARASASYLRFGSSVLLQAYRGSLQHQWEGYTPTHFSRLTGTAWSCRPSVAAEWEYRRYPSSTALDGIYQGAAAGLICRSDSPLTSEAAATPSAGIFNLQARLGNDRPRDATRAGGTYRKSELRAQWEGQIHSRGKLGLQWSSTLQQDSEPYSVFLGNVPRRIVRHALQVDGSWQLTSGLSLVSNAEVGSQRSNIGVFDTRQQSIYLGLRWELM